MFGIALDFRRPFTVRAWRAGAAPAAVAVVVDGQFNANIH